jgi:hypothetical protein
MNKDDPHVERKIAIRSQSSDSQPYFMVRRSDHGLNLTLN